MAIPVASSLLRSLIEKNAQDHFFSVRFIKRTTGELREMNCRLGVKKYLKGGPAAYDFKEKNLICVYDIQSKGYRCIPLENVLSLRVEGVEYFVR